MPATATTNNLTKVAEVEGSLKQVQQAVQAYQVARTTFINALSVSGNEYGRVLVGGPGNSTPRMQHACTQHAACMHHLHCTQAPCLSHACSTAHSASSLKVTAHSTLGLLSPAEHACMPGPPIGLPRQEGPRQCHPRGSHEE